MTNHSAPQRSSDSRWAALAQGTVRHTQVAPGTVCGIDLSQAKGLHVRVVSDSYRACGGPLTREHDKLTVVGIVDERYPHDLGNPPVSLLPPDSRVFEPSEGAPAVVLVRRGHLGDVIRPLEPSPADQTPYMMGGSYAVFSDSRWVALAGPDPLPVHDRSETWPHYNALTRD